MKIIKQLTLNGEPNNLSRYHFFEIIETQDRLKVLRVSLHIHISFVWHFPWNTI